MLLYDYHNRGFICLCYAELLVKFTIYGLAHQALICVNPITHLKKDIQLKLVSFNDFIISCYSPSKSVLLVLSHVPVFVYYSTVCRFTYVDLLLCVTLFGFV